MWRLERIWQRVLTWCGVRPRASADGIRELRGLGKEIWKDVDPDEYVRSLREGWD